MCDQLGGYGFAHDRLNGQQVALKRVTLAPEMASAAEDRLALAHEFRTLAGLRHPYIISVLDYGFDAEQQPFFTMELLVGAQSILEAGRDLPLEQRAELLTQALEALNYLHRRGVLHHDLKPENVLVAGGRARLLDFGLSVLAGQQRATAAHEDRLLAQALNLYGHALFERGQYTDALAKLALAMPIWQRLGGQRGQAQSLALLGSTQQHQGLVNEGIHSFEHSLHLYRELGDRPGIAECLIQLGGLRAHR